MKLKEETRDSAQVEFKIGEEVVIRNSGDTYCHTRDGSKGIIESIDEKNVYIHFYLYTGENYSPFTFPIYPEYVSKLTKLERILK